MGNAKHTPGPWKAESFAGQFNVWPISRKKPDGSAVAYDCTEDDARLIAAAPDLLAACKAMVEYQQLIDSDATTGLLEAYGNSFESAAAAVAKATGSPQ